MSNSIRFTQEDLDNIAKISLDRGGLSMTDSIRVALSETALKKPVLAIIPGMAPLKDVKAFGKIVEGFSDTLQFAVETGLPIPEPDASQADREAIKEARAKFESAYTRIEDMLLQIESFQRLVMAVPRASFVDLKAAADYVYDFYKVNAQRADDPSCAEADRKASGAWARRVQALIDWMRACGLGRAQ